MNDPPPCLLKIDGYHCRTWYRGQPLICNLCKEPGHRSAECPNKDKCQVCGQSGHIGRHCTNTWGGSRTLIDSTPPLDEEGLPLPSDPPSSLASSPEDSTSNESHSTDDCDSESETFKDVAESEQVGKDLVMTIAHDKVSLNANSIKDLDSAEIDDLIDDVNTHDSVDDPNVNDDVDGFVSAASTSVPCDEDDRSSVLSHDSSDITAMDDLCGTTCAPRKRQHASDGSDEDGGIATKMAIGSSDELAPLSGDAPVDPRSGLISVVDLPQGAPAPEGATQVTDPSGSVLGVSLHVDPPLLIFSS